MAGGIVQGPGGGFVTDANVQKAIEAAYYDTAAGGFANARQLYQYFRTEPRPATVPPNVRWPPSFATVRDVVQAQQVAQTTEPRRPPMTRKDYDTTVASELLSSVQGDLMEMKRLAKYNGTNPNNLDAARNGAMNYVLIMIDVASRRIWTRMLKKKDGAEVRNAVFSVIDEMNAEGGGRGFQVQNLNFDKEGVMTSAPVKQELANRGIRLWLSGPDRGKSTQYVVERVVRTLRQRMRRYFRAYETRRWVDVFDQIVASYNRSFHTSLAPYKSPEDLWNKWPNFPNGFPNPRPKYLNPIRFKNPRDVFNIGDIVRIAKPIQLLEKPTDQKLFSKNTYQIIGVAPNETSAPQQVPADGGLGYYNMGWANMDANENPYQGIPPAMQKVGRGRRFILRRESDGQIRERRWYNLKKVDKANLRTFAPTQAGARAGQGSFQTQINRAAALQRAAAPLASSAGFVQAAPRSRRGTLNFATINQLPRNNAGRKIKFNPGGALLGTIFATVIDYDQRARKVTLRLSDGSTSELPENQLKDATLA